MKTKLLLFLFTSLLLSCTGEKDKNSIVAQVKKNNITTASNSTTLEHEIAKQQTFTISNSTDTLIEGAKGTLIFIPRDAFAGALPDKPVKIELKEYYTKQEFIAANLTTTSDGQLLESGGMIHIRAMQDGSELTLKKDIPLQLYFPRKQDRKNMELFSGTRDSSGIMNWKKQKHAAEKINAPQPASTSEKQKQGAYMMQIEPYGGDISVRIAQHEDDSTFFLKGRKERLQQYIYSKIIAEPSIASDFLKLNGLYRLFFDVNKDGKIVNASIGLYIFYEGHNIRQTHDSLILSNAKPVTDHFFKYLTEAPKVYAGISISGQQFDTQQDFNVYFNKKYEKSSRKKIQQIDKDEVNYYVFHSNSTGWLNCDAFVKIDLSQKISMVIESADTTANVFFIYEELNSVVRENKRDGNQLTFSSIPLNKKVKVFSIATIDGKDKISLQQFTTSKNHTNIKLEYINFDLQKINAFLR
ncbi:MAG: hypothetical protein ACTHJT_07800 [Cytophaga sp.]|uniref:hypothetical protein n=1 Tax=Cytophaga sp. TaxID=29535 RepID=UPI003F7F136E